MFGQGKKENAFFDGLCVAYYEKILRYLYGALGDESAARDCTQDVFLTACQKCALLMKHPNPGGFLFQTAKNLAKKYRRESFRRLLCDDASDTEESDPSSDIEVMLDCQVDEQAYIETVLSQLSDEKRGLYSHYYTGGKAMAEIAALYGVTETAMRMRYVRLRREIREIAAEVAEQNFVF